MASTITVTVTDITKPPQNLATLLSGGTVAGYTIVPALGTGGLLGTTKTFTQPQYVSVQASYGNGVIKIYKGDENVKTDGSCQGKEMAAGDTDVLQPAAFPISLQEIYITASANTGKFNVEIHF